MVEGLLVHCCLVVVPVWDVCAYVCVYESTCGDGWNGAGAELDVISKEKSERERKKRKEFVVSDECREKRGWRGMR